MGFEFTRELTVEWGHCDPAGIVFNPRFFEYFDWSTALLVNAALDLGAVDMRIAYGVAGIPLVDTRANFVRPARYGDQIAIVSKVSKIGRSSFEIDHRLFVASQLAVEGHEKRVWTVRDPETGQLRSRALPEEVARRLAGG